MGGEDLPCWCRASGEPAVRLRSRYVWLLRENPNNSTAAGTSLKQSQPSRHDASDTPFGWLAELCGVRGRGRLQPIKVAKLCQYSISYKRKQLHSSR